MYFCPRNQHDWHLFCLIKSLSDMNMNNRFFSITLLTVLLSMGILSVFGQGFDFASKVKSSIANVQKEADKDPDTFKENIAKLEKEWNGRKDPVEQSVAHAMLGSAYREMKWTHITDFDEETRGDYDTKSTATTLSASKKAPRSASSVREKGKEESNKS